MITGSHPMCFPGNEPDCDCPLEHWHVNHACVDIHVEEEGYTHAIIDTGDWQDEEMFPAADTLDKGRPLALAWAEKRLS